MPGTSTSNEMTNTVAEKLQEGFYTFNMTISMFTPSALASLNNMNGLNQIQQVPPPQPPLTVL